MGRLLRVNILQHSTRKTSLVYKRFAKAVREPFPYQSFLCTRETILLFAPCRTLYRTLCAAMCINLGTWVFFCTTLLRIEFFFHLSWALKLLLRLIRLLVIYKRYYCSLTVKISIRSQGTKDVKVQSLCMYMDTITGALERTICRISDQKVSFKLSVTITYNSDSLQNGIVTP